jgi:hypothetical protein
MKYSVPTLSSPSSWQPQIRSLSVDFPIKMFPINGLRQHVVFYVWLLSLSTMFLNFLHIVT